MGKMLVIRKLADKSTGTRVQMYDPITGEKRLVNPETPGTTHEPWPLAGIQIEGEIPSNPCPAMDWVARAVAEGWIELENEGVEHAPGGPENNQWAVTHTFVTADAITIKTVDGDVRYRVVQNPGKYDDENEPSGKRVDWSYHLELE